MNYCLFLALLPMLLAGMAARADIVLSYSTDGGVNYTTVASTADNSLLQFAGSLGGFNIASVAAAGESAFGTSGELLDVSVLAVSTRGTGTLDLRIAESNLASAGPQYAAAFSALSNNATASRGFTASGTATGQSLVLGETTQNSGASTVEVSGGISTLVESISLRANGTGATLSSDDAVTAAPVPVPPAVWLLGSGLVVMAGVGRRRERR